MESGTDRKISNQLSTVSGLFLTNLLKLQYTNDICSGPISAEVTALDTEGMVEQGRILKKELPENVIIKIEHAFILTSSECFQCCWFCDRTRNTR